MKNIGVYCGSSGGANPAYREAARLTGRLLAERGLGLVYGGGKAGLMGEVANAVLEAGGRASGVITERLVGMEVAHKGLTDLRVVSTMHERKFEMMAAADGFIALPGGIGTFEELFEVLTWLRLDIHGKPCGVLNTAGFYDKMIDFLDHVAAEGFLPEAHRRLLLVDDTPAGLLDKMQAFAEQRKG